MEVTILIILAVVFFVVGLVFSVLPPLPGPPIAFLALISLLWWPGLEGPSTTLLIIWGIIAVGSTFMDNVLTVYGAKLKGGTNAGAWGSMIGLIAGMFLLGPMLGPFAIIVGPFAGAVLFEMATGQEFNKALKSGLGSFLGFMAGTLLKVGVTIALIVVYIQLLT